MAQNDYQPPQPDKDVSMSVRIDPELRAALLTRAESSGRKQTTELLRLARKGIAMEDATGARGDFGYELLLAFSIGGARGAIEELLKIATPMELRQYILSAEATS